MIATEVAQPWFAKLPSNWQPIAIKRVVSTKITDGPHETPELSNDGIPFISAEAIKDDRINFDLRRGFISPELHEQYSRKCKPQRNDIFVVKSGATTGNVACVDVDLDFNIWSPLALIRCDPRHASYRFIYYVLLSDVFRKQVEISWSFGTQQNIGMRVIERLKVPLPPLPEQERIAAYLNKSCAALDAAVAAKRRQLETLDALRKSTIQRVVTRGLSESGVFEQTGNVWLEEVPRGWSLVCLKRVAEIQGGLTLGKTYEGPLIERPYLRVGNVQDGHLNLSDVSLIELPATVAAGVELRRDDVLMTEGGDLDKLGRGYLWNGEIEGCLHQNHIFAVRCFRHKLLPRFLTYVTASKYGRDYFEATGKRTTNLACTNATKVGAFPTPLPELKEQVRLVASLEAKLGEIKQLTETIRRQIESLLAYRKSLIHECVTGQRRVSEADVHKVQKGEGTRRARRKIGELRYAGV